MHAAGAAAAARGKWRPPGPVSRAPAAKSRPAGAPLAGKSAVRQHRQDARNGANNGTRTRDIQDHNLALYQLSYVRHPGGRV